MSARDSVETQEYGTVIVVGGGCYGMYYVQQLQRARAAGALIYERITVVDRDSACSAARQQSGDVQLECSDWSSFFDRYLAQASQTTTDAIVPSPLMPHLMYEWLLRRAAARWPHRIVETRPIGAEVDVPWQRVAADGTQYVSYATWTCPINCIEPRRCPHTRGDRSWTMPAAAAKLVASEQSRGKRLEGPVIFHCTHRAYGVGMFDTRDVLIGDATVRAAGDRGEVDMLVGTVSHCHGALNVLHVGV
jgi:hypothetical protein